MPVLDDAIGVGVLGTELGDDGSIRGTFEGGCKVDIFVCVDSKQCASFIGHMRFRRKASTGSTAFPGSTLAEIVLRCA